MYNTSTAMDVRAKPMTAPARKATLKEGAQPDCVAPIVVLAFENTATYRMPRSHQRSDGSVQNPSPYSSDMPLRLSGKLYPPPEWKEYYLPNTKLKIAQPDCIEIIAVLAFEKTVIYGTPGSNQAQNETSYKLLTESVKYAILTNRKSRCYPRTQQD